MSRQGDAPARPLWEHVEGIRVRNGWTKIQLSNLTGVNRQTFANWKTQPQPPLPSTVAEVADALEIPRETALKLAGIIPAEVPMGEIFTPGEWEVLESIFGDQRKEAELVRILAERGQNVAPTEADSDERQGHKAS